MCMWTMIRCHRNFVASLYLVTVISIIIILLLLNSWYYFYYYCVKCTKSCGFSWIISTVVFCSTFPFFSCKNLPRVSWFKSVMFDDFFGRCLSQLRPAWDDDLMTVAAWRDVSCYEPSGWLVLTVRGISVAVLENFCGKCWQTQQCGFLSGTFYFSCCLWLYFPSQLRFCCWKFVHIC